MLGHARVAAALLVLCPFAAAGRAQPAATLRTSDTAVGLRAAPSGPTMVFLRSTASPSWRNRESEPLVDFAVAEGVRIPLRWRWNRRESRVGPQSVSFVYHSRSPRLRLRWMWTARARSGPLEHTISIENLSGRELLLGLQESLRFAWEIPAGAGCERLSIEKGGGAPGPSGTLREPVVAGALWEGHSSSYAREGSRPREIIPFLLVQSSQAPHRGFYVGAEFSGRVRLSLERTGDLLRGSAGLDPGPAAGLVRLAAGEQFRTPTVFLGAARDGVEATGNALRRWIRGTLARSAAKQDARYPYLVLNSWGSGMAIDESLARRMLKDAADLGFEMFHVDAGWFRSVGDWRPDPRKFPGGLAALAEEAHRAGLKFGLWVDWTQAGAGGSPTALNVHDPLIRDWLVADPPEGWQPEEFKGMTVDLGLPAAADWARQETTRIVSEYRLDMLEHDGYLVAQGCSRADHPHAPPDPARTVIETEGSWPFVLSTNSADVSLRATNAYYDIQDSLRRAHPGLLLEVCNDGGRMVDFGSAAHADYFSITDAYDPVSNRRAFFDASHVLPAAMLETYVEKWPAPRIENFLYMLRSGMMGWFTLMQDPSAWSPAERAAARRELVFYKEKLRPLVRSADLYHLTPRPDGAGWDALEYFDPARRSGAIYVFRGSRPAADVFPIAVKALGADRRYRLRFRDHPSDDVTVEGARLSDGFAVRLPLPNSSEIVLFDEVRDKAAQEE
jgi:hypothetical protein